MVKGKITTKAGNRCSLSLGIPGIALVRFFFQFSVLCFFFLFGFFSFLDFDFFCLFLVVAFFRDEFIESVLSAKLAGEGVLCLHRLSDWLGAG
jgi:hypothetical protein